MVGKQTRKEFLYRQFLCLQQKEACRRINDEKQYGQYMLESISESAGFKSKFTYTFITLRFSKRCEQPPNGQKRQESITIQYEKPSKTF